MAKPGSTYKDGAFSGPGAVHQGSRVGSLRRINQIPRVQGERRAMPLLTSTTAGQGSAKSAEKGYGETWVTTGLNHGRTWSTKPQCRPNPEQGQDSRA